MICKKIDRRIQALIKNGIDEKHRTMFVVIGKKAKDQVVLLHHMFLKSSISKGKPSTILWCSKKELGINKHHHTKRIKLIKNKVKAGKLDVNGDDPFELFVVANNIRYCYYHETQNILGNTYDMCILQDFEALTPNILARTIETVEGGGIIIILLPLMNSLKQLFSMPMDVHQRFRTEAHQDIICRFNERFLLSLSSCTRCLIVDDNLQPLPITLQHLEDPSAVNNSLIDKIETNLNETIQDNEVVSALINCCKTFDQSKALHKFIETISEKTLNATVSLTAARGRGKSATLGLAIAGAVAFGYSNIFISSPTPENLNTLFEFIFKGFDTLSYNEHSDYCIVQSTNAEYNRAIVRVNIFRNHRQTIQYLNPSEVNKLSHAELLVIDEAAAIPLSYIKAMLGPYLVFLTSTINGYEGTGRSLSLKLLQQLRIQATISNDNHDNNTDKLNKVIETKRQLYELTLNESIRYKPGDKVEEWLTNILCLDATANITNLSAYPSPNTCELYYINRDTLFSYHKTSELFLQRLIALYVASHYKNSPNDLQMMCDAPAHHLFCLLGPIDPDSKSLPEILVVIQVCLEGEINNATIVDGLGRGKRAAGDLIPWTVAQQYQDNDFAQLAGARIVRIATHPDCHKMGYGTRALQLLKQYYEMKTPNIDKSMRDEENKRKIVSPELKSNLLLEEMIQPRADLPPLLSKLTERKPERLYYLGVSFGLTESLLKFWKRSNFVLVYLRQTTNDITGEHSCIMLSKIDIDGKKNFDLLETYWKDFRRRFVMLLSYSFNMYSPSFALSVLTNKNFPIDNISIDKKILNIYFITDDLKRLEMYSSSMVDYHLIMDLLPSLAKLYFFNLMCDTHLSPIQAAILLGLGLQHKTVDRIAEELSLPTTQLLGLFNRIVRKFIQYLNTIAKDSTKMNTIAMERINDGEFTLQLQSKQQRQLKRIKRKNMDHQYVNKEEAKLVTDGFIVQSQHKQKKKRRK